MTDPESITYAEYRGMVEKIEFLEGVQENLTEELRLARREIEHLRAIVHATTAPDRAERASAANRGYPTPEQAEELGFGWGKSHG